MYAIIQDSGRQYKVEKDKEILVDRKSLKEGTIEFSDVLLYNDGTTTKVGTPIVAGVKVIGEIKGEEKGKKIRVFKYKRRKGYHKTIGHRQKYTRVKIIDIIASSESPSQRNVQG
jgi:large subunit ribosomal protein L21